MSIAVSRTDRVVACLPSIAALQRPVIPRRSSELPKFVEQVSASRRRDSVSGRSPRLPPTRAEGVTLDAPDTAVTLAGVGLPRAVEPLGAAGVTTPPPIGRRLVVRGAVVAGAVEDEGPGRGVSVLDKYAIRHIREV